MVDGSIIGDRQESAFVDLGGSSEREITLRRSRCIRFRRATCVAAAVLSSLGTSLLIYFRRVDVCAHLQSNTRARHAATPVLQPLRFRADGTFRILQLTDLHIRCWPDTGATTLSTIEALLDAEQPDFVAYTGDICEGSGFSCQTSARQEAIMRAAFHSVESRGIPWAVLYGNWDRKPEAAWTGTQANEFVMSSFNYNLNANPPPGVNGDTVFDIPVYPPVGWVTPLAVLYFFDTHANEGCMGSAGTGCIYASEVHWYREVSSRYRTLNHDRLVPAVGFLHIPLPEYLTAWNEADVVQGHLDESLASSGHGISCVLNDSKLFAAAQERGDIIAFACGHDHNNDFSAHFRGIDLMYGRKTGYGSYGPPVSWGASPSSTGARVIELRYEAPSLDVKMSSWIRLMDGTKLQPIVWTETRHKQIACNYAS